MKKLIAILSISFLSAQSTNDPYYGNVGIGTTKPTARLHVYGKLKINTDEGLPTDSILVIRNKEIMKIAVSSLNISNSGTCPNFLKNQSNGYNVYFSSPSSVPNPNNALNIQGKNFAPTSAFILNNTYYYSWSNTTGQPININNMTVNFSGLICNYQ